MLSPFVFCGFAQVCFTVVVDLFLVVVDDVVVVVVVFVIGVLLHIFHLTLPKNNTKLWQERLSAQPAGL